MSAQTDKIFGMVVVLSGAIGIAIGCVGLGVGLVFLTIQQAIGLGILSTGSGTVFGLLFLVKRIAKAVLETIKELEVKSRPQSDRSEP